MSQIISSLQSLIDSCIVRRYDKGRIILYQGEVPRHVFVVKKGIIKAYSITQLGEEKIATFIAKDEVFPLIAFNSLNASSMYYYEALTDCELSLVPREDFIAHIQNDPSATMQLFQYATKSYLGSQLRVTALQQPKAQDKIVHALYQLMQRYGSEKKPPYFEIDMQLTHQTIASYVGLTRETVATEISRLKRHGVLQYKNQRYTINKNKLLALVNEDSLSSFEF